MIDYGVPFYMQSMMQIPQVHLNAFMLIQISLCYCQLLPLKAIQTTDIVIETWVSHVWKLAYFK